MGLDVYVGSLTRYYSGDWETVVQKWGREHGTKVQIVRPPGTEDPATDPSEILPAILAWREGLNQGLAEAVEAPLAWNESPDAPYFTDKPSWDCYSDLLLWAAYDEHRELVRPSGQVQKVEQDPAFAASAAKGSGTRYPNLLSNAEVWLPCDFRFVFEGPDPAGRVVTFGSSVCLARELEELNERTWKADDQTLATWPKEWFECGTPLERGARFAFSIFLALSRQSVEHHLPMKLDY